MEHRLPLAQARRTTTPSATMHRYADTSGEPTRGVAVWRTEIPRGASGPVHTIDREHVIVVLEGALVADIDDERHEVLAGDALYVPSGAVRRLAASDRGDTVTLTSSLPGSLAVVGAGEPVAVPWAG